MRLRCKRFWEKARSLGVFRACGVSPVITAEDTKSEQWPGWYSILRALVSSEVFSAGKGKVTDAVQHRFPGDLRQSGRPALCAGSRILTLSMERASHPGRTIGRRHRQGSSPRLGRHAYVSARGQATLGAVPASLQRVCLYDSLAFQLAAGARRPWGRLAVSMRMPMASSRCPTCSVFRSRLLSRSAARYFPCRSRMTDRRSDLYVPTDISSRGLDYVADRLREYCRSRWTGGHPAVVGDRLSRFDGRGICRGRTAGDGRRSSPYVEGFVWTPLGAADFAEAATAAGQRRGQPAKLVDLPAYAEQEGPVWLDRVSAFLSNGGDGIVAVRGLEVPRSCVPDPAQWPYETPFRCGATAWLPIGSVRSSKFAVHSQLPSSSPAAVSTT